MLLLGLRALSLSSDLMAKRFRRRGRLRHRLSRYGLVRDWAIGARESSRIEQSTSRRGLEETMDNHRTVVTTHVKGTCRYKSE